mmetsp:Transcript_12298/g.32424  ORF Transcript_12298/g.32424 Transcript_12298/m.32424 type:complete len:136 (-) Transcript_12298:65-472(-)
MSIPHCHLLYADALKRDDWVGYWGRAMEEASENLKAPAVLCGTLKGSKYVVGKDARRDDGELMRTASAVSFGLVSSGKHRDDQLEGLTDLANHSQAEMISWRTLQTWQTIQDSELGIPEYCFKLFAAWRCQCARA